MKFNFTLKKIKSKGFSLIELLVVIAIIGILTAIITANLTQSRSKAKDAKRVSDVAQIQLALEMLFDRCNKYPTSIDASELNTTVCTTATVPYSLGYFISAVPTDNGTPYIYAVDDIADTKDYVLKAALETKASVLIDAYSTDKANYYVNSVQQSLISCSNHATAPYDYCVVPK